MNVALIAVIVGVGLLALAALAYFVWYRKKEPAATVRAAVHSLLGEGGIDKRASVDEEPPAKAAPPKPPPVSDTIRHWLRAPVDRPNFVPRASHNVTGPPARATIKLVGAYRELLVATFKGLSDDVAKGGATMPELPKGSPGGGHHSAHHPHHALGPIVYTLTVRRLSELARDEPLENRCVALLESLRTPLETALAVAETGAAHQPAVSHAHLYAWAVAVVLWDQYVTAVPDAPKPKHRQRVVDASVAYLKRTEGTTLADARPPTTGGGKSTTTLGGIVWPPVEKAAAYEQPAVGATTYDAHNETAFRAAGHASFTVVAEAAYFLHAAGPADLKEAALRTLAVCKVRLALALYGRFHQLRGNPHSVDATGDGGVPAAGLAYVHRAGIAMSGAEMAAVAVSLSVARRYYLCDAAPASAREKLVAAFPVATAPIAVPLAGQEVAPPASVTTLPVMQASPHEGYAVCRSITGHRIVLEMTATPRAPPRMLPEHPILTGALNYGCSYRRMFTSGRADTPYDDALFAGQYAFYAERPTGGHVCRVGVPDCAVMEPLGPEGYAATPAGTSTSDTYLTQHYAGLDQPLVAVGSLNARTNVHTYELRSRPELFPAGGLRYCAYSWQGADDNVQAGTLSEDGKTVLFNHQTDPTTVTVSVAGLFSLHDENLGEGVRHVRAILCLDWETAVRGPPITVTVAHHNLLSLARVERPLVVAAGPEYTARLPTESGLSMVLHNGAEDAKAPATKATLVRCYLGPADTMGKAVPYASSAAAEPSSTTSIAMKWGVARWVSERFTL